MKLWEVLKAYDEDRSKSFSCDNAFVESYKVESYKNDGKFVWIGTTIIPTSLLNSDWQLVRQPVTWQEAVQEFAKGKKLIVKFNNQEWTLDALVELPNYLDVAITKGTWYVED